MASFHSASPYAPPRSVERLLRQPVNTWFIEPVLVVVIVVIVGILFAIWWHVLTDMMVCPIELEIQASMVQIETATYVSRSETGVAPTTLEGLKGLIDSGYLAASPDPDDLIWQMLAGGVDYFGNPVRLQPVKAKPGYYELRSSGRDGKFDTGNASDDIFIQYPATP